MNEHCVTLLNTYSSIWRLYASFTSITTAESSIIQLKHILHCSTLAVKMNIDEFDACISCMNRSFRSLLKLDYFIIVLFLK